MTTPLAGLGRDRPCRNCRKPEGLIALFCQAGCARNSPQEPIVTKQTPVAEPTLTRRGLLLPVTAGFGLATLGLGLWALARGTRAQSVPRYAASIDLASLCEGEQTLVKVRQFPVWLRHRTGQEIASAEADDLAGLCDPLARKLNLDPDAKATDLNRHAGRAVHRD